MSNIFRIARNTINLIVTDTCKATIESIGPQVLKTPSARQEWEQKGNEFGLRWNFPQAVGAVDSKHIYIRKPFQSVSLYRNYKDFFSIVLFAIVDANYKFYYVDVGNEGSVGDASAWNQSPLKKSIETNQINFSSI